MDRRRRLYVVVPFFPADDHLAAKEDAFTTWWNEHSDQLRRVYELSHIENIPLLPAKVFTFNSGVTIKLAPQQSQHDLALARQGRAAAVVRVPKGIAVRLAIAAALDDVDGHSVALRTDSYIVQIDGSGAFNYNNIETILEKLIYGDVDVVFGLRPGEDRMMGDPKRVHVEKWEQYLLETALWRDQARSYQLPDSQAGCWGLRCSALRHIALTAPGYELEFDLIASVLQTRVKYQFSDPLEAGKRVGVSGITNHLAEVGKMPFIAQKLNFTPDQISVLLNKYVETTNLPEGYVKAIRDVFLK